MVQFAGDIHQPLHAGYRDDRGSNLHPDRGCRLAVPSWARMERLRECAGYPHRRVFVRAELLVAERRLREAGRRLAEVLNTALAPWTSWLFGIVDSTKQPLHTFAAWRIPGILLA